MPYRFLDSEKHKKKLNSQMEHYGFEFNFYSESYREKSISFESKWDNSAVLLIKWVREFVADGTDEQDSQIILYFNENEIGTIEVDSLLKSKLDSSLNEVIFNRISDLITQERDKTNKIITSPLKVNLKLLILKL